MTFSRFLSFTGEGFGEGGEAQNERYFHGSAELFWYQNGFFRRK